jgi:hypothetical protein
VVPDAVDPQKNAANLYVNNINVGIEGVEPGTVKYIRISQHMPWPCVRDTENDRGIDFDDVHYNPAGPWTRIVGFNGWSPARAIGVVPVEEDGSAHFEVPVLQPIYFQALDENFMEVRRMRSNVTFQPGETRGCIGCHETRSVSPREIMSSTPMAARRPASTPVPPPWGSAVVPSFEEHIQPILDRSCVSCHGQKNPAGGIELTGRKVSGYNQAYRSLFGLKADEPTPARSFYVGMWHKGNESAFTTEGERDWFKKYFNNQLPGQLVSISDYMSGAEVTEPYAYGSTKSKFITTLLNSPLHKRKVKLSKEDWMALVTWVDLNACYHSSYTYFGTNERVPVDWPDPWDRAPAGEWLLWQEGGEKRVVLKQ